MILCLSAPVPLAETATRAHLDAVEDPPATHLKVIDVQQCEEPAGLTSICCHATW
jgi:hypothetical protein